jgi:hypothetical protein
VERSNQESEARDATLPDNHSAVRPRDWAPSLPDQLLGIWKGGDEGSSWLFSGMLRTGQTVEGIFGLLWLIPLVGFVVVSWGYLTRQGWWLQLALTSAAISLAMIVLWWGGLIVGSAFFALVFDLAIMAVVLWQLRSGPVIS